VRFSDEWVRTSGRIGISAYIDDLPAEIEWRGNYLKLTRLGSGQKVRILHPLFDEEKVEIVGGRRFGLLWRGNTVIGISPSGEKFPFYERR